MEEFEDLIRDIRALRIQFAQLADQLTAAADDLKNSGIPLSATLSEDLIATRRSFETICERYRDMPDIASGSRSVGSSLRSLEHLEEMLCQAKEEFDRRKSEERLRRSLAILEQLNQLEHVQSNRDELLEFVRREVARLQTAALDEADNPQIPDLAQLINGEHPLLALYWLVTNHETLDEDELERHQAAVEKLFGRKTAIAAIAGRLRIKEPAPEERPAKRDEPSDKSAAEPITESATSQETMPDAELVEQTNPLVAKPLAVLPSEEVLAFDREGDKPETAALPLEDSDATAPPQHVEIESASAPAAPPKRAATKHVQTATAPCPTNLPEELASYEEFCRRHYVSLRDQVEPAWWVEQTDEFISRADGCLEQLLKEGRLGYAWIIARAMEDLGKQPPVNSQDLKCAASLLCQPEAAMAGFDSERVNRLRKAGTLEQATDPRLALVLESLCPSDIEPLSDHEADGLAEKSKFLSPELREFVRMSLRLHSHGLSCVKLLRDRIQEREPASPAEIRDQLTRKRTSFHDEVVRLWSGAGGGLKLSHCRKAWDKFIDSIKETISQLYPPSKGGRETWNTTEMEQRLQRIDTIHRKVLDKGEVKFQERRKADNAAVAIQTLGLEVNRLMRDLQQAEGRAASLTEQFVPLKEIRQLIASPPEADAIERLCGEILQATFQEERPPHQGQGTLVLGQADFIAFPDFLGLVPPDALQSATNSAGDGAEVAVPFEDITNPQQAGAYLLELCPRGSDADWQSLKDGLRKRGRWDLLHRISGLSEQEKGWVRHARRMEWEQVNPHMAELHRNWRHLSDMAEPLAARLGTAYREVGGIRDRMLNDDLELRILGEWLQRLNEFATRACSLAKAQLEILVEQTESETAKQAALERINAHCYADALLILGRQEVPKQTRERETIWRSDAKNAFPEPSRLLHAMAQASSDLKDIKEFIEDWRRGYLGGSPKADRPLRTRFARLMFASRETDRNDVPRGSNENESFRVDCQAILDWFAHQTLNPSFMPQLRLFSQIAILTPWEPVSSPSLVQRLRSQVANETANGSLCIVLAPRLTEQVREEVLYEFRKDGLSAGILDDLDLCRLLNPSGRRLNLIMALLEIVFEQQKSGAFSPFERHDGQHVRMEMFVGREEQARDLAWTSNYTRLFSGRKLGKSALLSFVQQTYDRTRLPSGNTLRVLYVSGVSAGEEAEMVDRVLKSMRDHLGFVPLPHDDKAEAKDRSRGKFMVRAFEQFVAERPNESVLVLFDEADLFVERQVADYEVRREECLSFLIRSQIESHKDSRGLPRVRFLFSGYRVTHLSAGAWAGAWGDVLRLQPLAPEDASRLVRGPLERLGIDAVDVAPSIAWRCGYQPAIIIAFCRQLLQELSRHNARLTVDDVTAVFESPSVQDEIRTVIESNFQGNPLGRIVFLATVLEFYERRPGEGVQELPEILFKRFCQIDQDIEWLESADDQSAMSRIASLVQDFVRRQLLRMESSTEGVATFFPAFPHHLPILAEELTRDPEGRIRREIDTFRRGQRGVVRDAGQIRSLLSGPDLQALRNAVSSPADAELPLRAAVLVTSWPDAVPLSLIAPTAKPKTPPNDQTLLKEMCQDAVLVMLNAGGEMVEPVLKHRESSHVPALFVGGADLLREVLWRERKLDELFEVRSIGRITQAQLEWWFNRMRALEFESHAYDQFMSRTSGIPFLMQLLDRLLLDRFAGGGNVSERELDEVLTEFDSRLPGEIQSLRDGKPAVRLEPRELEILQMVANAGTDANPGKPLSEHLTTLWEFYAEASPYQPLSPEDHVAMQVVQRLGFVPVNPNASVDVPLDRFVGLEADDALIRVGHALGGPQCN